MISIKSINKVFESSDDSFYALKDINFDIEDGELVLVYGKSGSGKSTLLSIIASIMKPTDGAVYVDGENIVSYNDYFASLYRSKKVGIITQSFHLFDLLSVDENIKIPLVLSKLSSKEIDKKVQDVAKLCNISHKLKMPVKTLSGGERQRCTIARALINDPDIILCDEPTANLDRSNALVFIDILKKLKSMGKTIVIATHDSVFEELDIVDRSLYMDSGEIVS